MTTATQRDLTTIDGLESARAETSTTGLAPGRWREIRNGSVPTREEALTILEEAEDGYCTGDIQERYVALGAAEAVLGLFVWTPTSMFFRSKAARKRFLADRPDWS